MNMKLILIGAVFIVLLVAFGRNPVEEGRERRAKAMEGKDPLIHAIQEHNSENKTGSRGGRKFSPRGPRGTGAKNMPSGAVRVGDNKKNNIYRTQNRATMYGAPPTPTGTQTAPTPSIQNSQGGYYPPPASSGNKNKRR